MDTKISIIIPCYNAEKFLGECLDSVLGQTLKDIEVICVDDGSSDNTLAILDEYALKHSNVIVLKQTNNGPGAARNSAILHAKGKYIAFMDSDDFYYSDDTLQKMYEKAEEKSAFICGGSVCNFRSGVYTYDGLRPGMVFSQDGWISKEEFEAFAGYWRFIYNRRMILDNRITFPDYRRCEDPVFFLKAIAASKRVYCLKDITYCYRKEHKKDTLDLEKSVHSAMGMRDSLRIAVEADMKNIFPEIIKDIHGELSALIYRFAALGDERMYKLAHELNEIIGVENKDGLLLEGDEINEYVARIDTEKKNFFDSLNNKRILVFGAGIVGKQVAGFLKDNNIRQEAFVVSDMKQNEAVVEGVAVHLIDDYVDKRDECVVIIATFPYLHDEIKGILENKGFENVFALDLEKFFLFQDIIKH